MVNAAPRARSAPVCRLAGSWRTAPIAAHRRPTPSLAAATSKRRSRPLEVRVANRGRRSPSGRHRMQSSEQPQRRLQRSGGSRNGSNAQAGNPARIDAIPTFCRPHRSPPDRAPAVRADANRRSQVVLWPSTTRATSAPWVSCTKWPASSNASQVARGINECHRRPHVAVNTSSVSPHTK